MPRTHPAWKGFPIVLSVLFVLVVLVAMASFTPPRKPPKRPPPIRLAETVLNDKLTPFCPHNDCVDTPRWIELAAAREVSSPPARAVLTVLTWNVWFDRMLFDQRLDAIIVELLSRRPNVACFQEVTPRFASAVRNSRVLNQVYAVSQNTIYEYGCMMLVNKSWAPTFEEIALPTRMGRSLLVSQFAHPSLGGDPALVHAVATVHLESLNSERARAEQLDICRAHLRPFSNAVLCGDFNFDSTQTWGDWRPGARPRPAAELENHVLARALPDFVDVWPLLRPEDAGITFDGASNPCVHDRAERMRYDRIVAAASPGSLLRPVAIEMIGTEPLADSRYMPSDHFGLLATFQFADCRPPARGCVTS